MKTRIKDKHKAIELRIKGYSYSQIKSELGLSKSTLSGWLKDFSLTPERIKELRFSEKKIEKYRETCRKRKDKILKEVYENEKKIIFPLTKRDLFIAGLFLYWGEGGKTMESQLTLSNTNPAAIKFFIHWLGKALNVKKEKVKIKLHLYKDMNIEEEIKFWMKKLNVKRWQFVKPYIKNSTKKSLTYKNGFGHGTCNASIGNAILGKKVLMGLKAVEDYFNLN